MYKLPVATWTYNAWKGVQDKGYLTHWHGRFGSESQRDKHNYSNHVRHKDFHMLYMFLLYSLISQSLFQLLVLDMITK